MARPGSYPLSSRIPAATAHFSPPTVSLLPSDVDGEEPVAKNCSRGDFPTGRSYTQLPAESKHLLAGVSRRTSTHRPRSPEPSEQRRGLRAQGGGGQVFDSKRASWRLHNQGQAGIAG